MPNYIITREACRDIVHYGAINERKLTHNVRSHNDAVDLLNGDIRDKRIIQVEIVMTGEATSLNPTWHKEDGWDKRRWAYARVINEDGEYTGQIITVYSTMSVDNDWTSRDSIGGLTSANQARYACAKVHGRWHILAPMQLASATLTTEFIDWLLR